MRLAKGSDIFMALGIAGILLVMFLPLPAPLIDSLITMSFSIAILIILTAMYVREPIEFAAYPSILLVATIFRLALNVATTRRILLHGHELPTIGPGAISRIIEFFGSVVIGGNYVVGFIIFIILTVINFIVITRGAGRIAEVAARFTLDGLPGKQMSIDADLNSGLITEDEARKRRERLTRETDFYGAMDGASKFVRGDAIAGIIITLINIIGGLVIGIIQRGMAAGDALRTYTTLTIGDGLVAQVPAIIIASSAGMIVSRASTEAEFTFEIARQLTTYPRALFATAVVLAFIGVLVGGSAFLLFWAFAGVCAYIGYRLTKKQREEELEAQRLEKIEAAKSMGREEPAELETMLRPDVLGFEVGYALVPLVDESKNGDVSRRIRALRRQFAEELGIILPLVHIRDNLRLKPNEYSVLIKGVEVVRGEVHPDKYLVVGYETPKIEGVKSRDPVFGVESVWIDDDKRDSARAMGYTVIDASTVVITHLSEIIKRHAHEIFTRQDTQRLLDIVKKEHPALVDDLVPNIAPLGVVHRVLQNLLRENVPIKDMVSILETLGDYAPSVKDPDALTEYARQALSRQITKMYITPKGEVLGITISPQVEDLILRGIEETDGSIRLKIEPSVIQNIVSKIGKLVEKFVPHKTQPLVISSSASRRYIKKMIEGYYPNVPVIAFQELDPKVKIRALGVVGLD